MMAFWKEYTITLPSKKEFVYDIQNKKTNCVFIQNHNIANVFAGLKPHAYEVEIPPNRTSIINRPSPIEYVYFYTEKQTPIIIVETITQNPIAKYIQQEVTKNVSINTTNTVIQNTLLAICQLNAFRPKIISRPVLPLTVIRSEFVYDLGSYGAPNIQIVVFCGRRRKYLTDYRFYVFNKNTGYIKIAYIRLPRTWGVSRPFPPEVKLYSDNIKLHSINDIHAHLTINNNTFRYLSIIGSNAPINPDATSPTVIDILR